jgi:hypothetical protein
MNERSTLRRLPARGSREREAIHTILDTAFVAHVGFAVDGQPFGRAGEKLFLHGSAASRMMRTLESGVPVCVTVTLVDGLVLARSAFHHSMNYRSVVLFGTARAIDDPALKTEALQVISEHLIAGRWAEVRAPNSVELKATTVLELTIEEASAKTRIGPPMDDEQDYALPVWAGVLPLSLKAGAPQPDVRLAEGIAAPDYIQRYSR